MLLESSALRLLATLTDEVTSYVSPLDFTALLYLQDRGFATVSVKHGRVVAERTAAGKEFSVSGTLRFKRRASQ